MAGFLILAFIIRQLSLVEKMSSEKDASMSSAETVPNEPEPRPDMVTTAIQFLENPKVAPSSESVKRAFLSKKGLTIKEIDEAFQRAQPPRPEPVLLAPSSPSTIMVPYSSGWSKFRDLANLVVLLMGAAYGIRYLWKTYFKQWLYGDVPPVKTIAQQTIKAQMKIEETLKSLIDGIEKLQLTLDTKVESLQKQLDRFETKVKSPSGYHELQKDIQSLKGLMLSSNQFPSNPPVKPISIPSWQLESTNGDTQKPGNPDLVQDQPGEESAQDSSSV